MLKACTLSKQIILCLSIIILAFFIEISQAKSIDELFNRDVSSSDNDETYDEQKYSDRIILMMNYVIYSSHSKSRDTNRIMKYSFGCKTII
mgnify:CR=1 FL=1